MKLAAIDIGSNSIKLIVVEAKSPTDFKVLAREKDSVRLGHETLRTRHLSPESIDRAAETIKRFNLTANVLRVEQVISIATASVREADNADEFVREIGKRTGVHTEVLSGAEEARLIGLAAAWGCSEATKRSGGRHAKSLHINIDIGGGSTEFSAMHEGEPVYLSSVRIGAVGLTEKLITTDPINQTELQTLRDEIDTTFQSTARELVGVLREYELSRVTGTSGTIIAIGNALNGEQSNVEKSNGGANKEAMRIANKVRAAKADNILSVAAFAPAQIELKNLDRFNNSIVKHDLANRKTYLSFSAQRAEIIVAGSHILAGAMRAMRTDSLTTCDWALREGVIVNRLREIEAERKPPVPDKSDPRLKSVHLIGTQFRYEEKHARHVAKLSERIFDDLQTLHGYARSKRTLLAAAALLHDIGYLIAHEPHHKHSYYIIKHCELTGFTERERQIIALVARYHRRALPKERHADFALLNGDEQKTVWCLGAILRLAEALDRNHDGRVRAVKCRVVKNSIVKVGLISERNCKIELRAANLNREMFEQAFGCKVSFAMTGKTTGKTTGNMTSNMTSKG